MSGIAVVFALVCAIALFCVPRRWAAVPLMVGACYMPLEQGIELGPFHFTVIRIMVAVGFTRALARREFLAGGLSGLDKLMAVWAAWACASSVFHNDPVGALVFRLGLVYNACGIYFLLRIFCTSVDDIKRLCRATAWMLLPIALEMVYEHVTASNLFAMLGAIEPPLREGRLRAVGPFSHPILAGTVGAATLPLMAALWRSHRLTAILGAVVCMTIVVASSSSGPLMSAFAGVGALCMWRYRSHMRLYRWLAFVGYVALDVVMKAPAYYLLARIDLVGGSTGWHRARLIQSAIEHLNEWWFAGTDYTRHWMETGVDWSPDQTDITNHYLHMGVLGGLPLMILFILVLAKAFSYVGQVLKEGDGLSSGEQFLVWALGASLFAHAVTSFSVSYFDQSFIFFYLAPAAIASARLQSMNAVRLAHPAPRRSPAFGRLPARSPLVAGPTVPAMRTAPSATAAARPRFTSFHKPGR